MKPGDESAPDRPAPPPIGLAGDGDAEHLMPVHTPGAEGHRTDQARAHPSGHRPIRSFGTRRGHMTTGQRAAYAQSQGLYCLPYTPTPLDWPSVFGNDHPVVLEIGCGMGETTAAIAAANPNVNYLGVEVYTAGVGALMVRLRDQGLGNVKIISHDAVEVLEHMVAADSLRGIHVFFPDPWHKKRHHKRRIIRPALVTLMASRLRPGGTLHCATDWVPYAEQMLEVLSAEPALRNRASGYHPRPAWRPLTKFEQRGMRLGHEVRDLIFERI